ncbi:MAG: pyridoxine 5'-phosphate synthase, partial [Rubripirellula sp.]
PYALASRHTLTDELARLSEAGKVTSALGMRLHAGHGLNYTNVRPVAAIPNMIELNIGHSVVSRALMVGMREAVAEMRRILDVCQPGQK